MKINFRKTHQIDIMELFNNVSEKAYDNYMDSSYSIYKSNNLHNRMIYVVHNVTDDIVLETSNVSAVLGFFENM